MAYNATKFKYQQKHYPQACYAPSSINENSITTTIWIKGHQCLSQLIIMLNFTLWNMAALCNFKYVIRIEKKLNKKTVEP